MYFTRKLALPLCLLIALTACGRSTVSNNSSSPKSSANNTVAQNDKQQTDSQQNSNYVSPNSTGQTATPANPSPPSASSQQPAPIAEKLDDSRHGWGYTLNSTHTAPVIPSTIRGWLPKYNAFYVGSTTGKKVYLTFDEGYENGCTPAILDTLKNHNVKACFFVTKSFITNNPGLVQRMVNEGHLVANHTTTHSSLNNLSEEKIAAELTGVEDAFYRVTGKNMSNYVRPPQGDFSEKSLWITNKLGYKTIFWSIAYRDWDTANQPTPEQAKALINQNIHNGAIILLHAVSKTNSDTLGDLIKIITSNGYTFGQISDL